MPSLASKKVEMGELALSAWASVKRLSPDHTELAFPAIDSCVDRFIHDLKVGDFPSISAFHFWKESGYNRHTMIKDTGKIGTMVCYFYVETVLQSYRSTVRPWETPPLIKATLEHYYPLGGSMAPPRPPHFATYPFGFCDIGIGTLDDQLVEKAKDALMGRILVDFRLRLRRLINISPADNFQSVEEIDAQLEKVIDNLCRSADQKQAVPLKGIRMNAIDDQAFNLPRGLQVINHSFIEVPIWHFLRWAQGSDWDNEMAYKIFGRYWIRAALSNRFEITFPSLLETEFFKTYSRK